MTDDNTQDFLALPSRRLFTGTDPKGLHNAISDVTANTHRMLLTEPNGPLSGEVHGLKFGSPRTRVDPLFTATRGQLARHPAPRSGGDSARAHAGLLR